MVEIPNEIIDKVQKFGEAIKNSLSVEKIFIFGSYANGKYNEYSDIDVCVIAKTSDNNYESLLKIINKTKDIDARIEPVVFSIEEFVNESDFGLLKEVKKYGLEIMNLKFSKVT